MTVQKFLTASSLRNNIYQLLDETLATGKPLNIKRKGKKIKITRVDDGSKLSRLPKHKCIVCNPEDLVHNDWSGEWNSDLP